jgi:hypothetical protein
VELGATPSRKASRLLFDGLGDVPQQDDDPEALWLTTVRSHDRYNGMLYSMESAGRVVYLDEGKRSDAPCSRSFEKAGGPIRNTI